MTSVVVSGLLCLLSGVPDDPAGPLAFLALLMGMTTLLLPGLCGVMAVYVQLDLVLRQRDLAERQREAGRSGDTFALLKHKLFHFCGSWAWAASTIVLPVISAAVGVLHKLTGIPLGLLAGVRFYSLFVYVLFAIIFLVKRDRCGVWHVWHPGPIAGVVVVILCVASTLALWLIPAVSPFRAFVYCLTAGEVAWAGTRFAQRA